MTAEVGQAPNRVYRAPDGSLHLNGAAVYDSAENNIAAALDLLSPLTDELALVSGVTASAAEINKVDGIPATGYLVAVAEVTFTQTAGDGTYTGTIALPAGSRIIDIGVDGQVLWAGGTSASLIVGDGADPDGFFTTTDLYATDLLAGEINNLEHPGGKAGAYIVSEQRNLYSASARNVIGVITQVGAGTAGRTRLYCVYGTPTAAAAVKA